jgi:hypothetical protein
MGANVGIFCQFLENAQIKVLNMKFLFAEERGYHK